MGESPAAGLENGSRTIAQRQAGPPVWLVAGLFLVTTALFWTGLTMFSRAFTGHVSAFLAATLLVGLSPPVFSMLSLARSWLQAIRSEPWSYAKHRIVLFLAHLGIGKNAPYRKLEFLGTSESFSNFYPYKGPTVFGMPHNR